MSGFYGLQSEYWSSTTKADDSNSAWLIRYGFISHAGKGGEMHVLPVRRITTETNDVSLPHAAISLPKTGQQSTYMTGDDGYWQTGFEWPNPRFLNNTDGTSTDRLTGLIWLENPECISDGSRWDEAIDSVNALASNDDHMCNLIDGSSAGDWRMPNVLELHSVIDFGRAQPALPVDHPFGPVAQFYPTWTSTTLSHDAAYNIDLGTGTVSEGDGYDLRLRVLAVR